MPRQSARSACPLMIVPVDRTWSKPVWKAMWRLARITWRDNHIAIERAFADGMIYGAGLFTPDLSGLKD